MTPSGSGSSSLAEFSQADTIAYCERPSCWARASPSSSCPNGSNSTWRNWLQDSASPPIDIGTMVDRDHLHQPAAVTDSVDDAVGPTPGTPETLELEAERLAHSMGCFRDVGDRLQYRSRSAFGQAVEIVVRGRHDLHPPAGGLQAGGRPPTTSSRGMPCPASASANPLRIFPINRLSERIARVSSRLSRSSGLMRTTAGRRALTAASGNGARATALALPPRLDAPLRAPR